MSQRFFGAVVVPTVRDCRPHMEGRPSSPRLGPAWLGIRWAANVAEHTEDTGPRLLCAPRRIYLDNRPGEPGPHGQNRRSPRAELPISNWSNKLLGRHPLNWIPLRPKDFRLASLPNSGGISPLNWWL